MRQPPPPLTLALALAPALTLAPALAPALALALALALAPPAALAADPSSLILATTTSTQDSGLLDDLVPRFEKQAGLTVKVIAIGSGAAIKMAARGDADVVLAHDPEAEKVQADAGELVDGKLVMWNDFVLVGPPDDPAGLKKAANLQAAMTLLAGHGKFVSRGDSSGTHSRELALWKAAGIDPATVSKREETGQGMGATLNVADQHRSYTLTDRATFLALKQKLALRILFEGDATLRNIYHVWRVSPERHPGVNAAGSRAFAEFLLSPEVQGRIARFRRAELGEAPFTPAALPAPLAAGW